MDDYAQIMNVVSRFLIEVDDRNWGAVREVMTDPFHADFSSLTGSPAMDATPEKFTEVWDSILSRSDGSQHQIGNQIVEIDGAHARFRCHVTASHYVADGSGGKIESIMGSYRIPLVRTDHGWKLAGVIFKLAFKTGGAD